MADQADQTLANVVAQEMLLAALIGQMLKDRPDALELLADVRKIADNAINNTDRAPEFTALVSKNLDRLQGTIRAHIGIPR